MKAHAVSIAAILLVAATLHARQLQAPPPVQPPPGWQPTPAASAVQPGAYKQESIEIVLEPKEGMEYKYSLDKGAALLYSWTSTAAIHYELHSEPEGAPRGFAETFDKQDSRDRAHGSYVAPYPGIHGWYWENRTSAPVTIRLTSAGFYTESREFRRGQRVQVRRFE